MELIRVKEYDAVTGQGDEPQIQLEKTGKDDGTDPQVVCTLGDHKIRIPLRNLDGNNKRLLGLTLDRDSLKLSASSFVGLVPLPGLRDVYLQVLPKMDNLDAAAMFMEVITHPVVGRHLAYGEVFGILVDENPVEVEEVPSVYLPMLLLAYLHLLNRLVQRGLQKGYVPRVHTLRGEVRGRILVGETFQRHHLRGYRHRVETRLFSYEEDTLENRILYAALKKAEDALAVLLPGSHGLGSLIARPKQVFAERVTLARIYPAEVVRARAGRARPDYRHALRLAAVILRHLGYDPLASLRDIHPRAVYPFWIDMNELFERFVEVKLRRGEIVFEVPDGTNGNRRIENYEVFAGYGQGGGVWTGVGELRPDFVVVSKEGNLVMIADAKYKLLYAQSTLKEDLQQIALYGRIQLDKLLKKYMEKHNFAQNNLCPPYLWILYPAKDDGAPEGFKAFVHMGKIPVKVPLRESGAG